MEGGRGDEGVGGQCIPTQEHSRQEPPQPRPGLGLQDAPPHLGQHLPTTLCPSQAIWTSCSSPEGPHTPRPSGQAPLVWEAPAEKSSPWRYLSPELRDTSPGVPPALRWPLSPAGQDRKSVVRERVSSPV